MITQMTSSFTHVQVFNKYHKQLFPQGNSDIFKLTYEGCLMLLASSFTLKLRIKGEVKEHIYDHK